MPLLGFIGTCWGFFTYYSFNIIGFRNRKALSSYSVILFELMLHYYRFRLSSSDSRGVSVVLHFVHIVGVGRRSGVFLFRMQHLSKEHSVR